MTAQKTFQIAAWFCFAAIVVLSLVSPTLRPVTFLPHNFEHAAIFALAGLAVGLGYPNRSAWHMATLAIFAAAIELAQFYAPGGMRVSSILLSTRVRPARVLFSPRSSRGCSPGPPRERVAPAASLR